jgi:hypothetical protein
MPTKSITITPKEHALLMKVKASMEKKWGTMSLTDVARKAFMMIARAEGIKPEDESKEGMNAENHT